MPKHETFGARLRRLRGDRTQTEIAFAAGLGQHQISDYEREQYEPSLEIAKRLAKALGCTIDELAGAKP